MATLPRPESDDIQSWGFRLVDDLENELEKINQAANTGDESLCSHVKLTWSPDSRHWLKMRLLVTFVPPPNPSMQLTKKFRDSKPYGGRRTIVESTDH